MKKTCLFKVLYELDDLKGRSPAQVAASLRKEFNIEADKLPPEEIQPRLQEAQKELILEYTKLPVVQDSIDGRRSIQKAYLEMSQTNHGIRRYLPRKKDKKHNKRVMELGEVVGFRNVSQFLRMGYFFPDNFVTGYLYAQAITLFPPLFLGPAKPAAYLIDFCLAIGAGLLISRLRKEDSSEIDLCSNGESRAIYVDKKIGGFFRK